jgi:hypothetical protein
VRLGTSRWLVCVCVPVDYVCPCVCVCVRVCMCMDVDVDVDVDVYMRICECECVLLYLCDAPMFLSHIIPVSSCSRSVVELAALRLHAGIAQYLSPSHCPAAFSHLVAECCITALRSLCILLCLGLFSSCIASLSLRCHFRDSHKHAEWDGAFAVRVCRLCGCVVPEPLPHGVVHQMQSAVPIAVHLIEWDCCDERRCAG